MSWRCVAGSALSSTKCGVLCKRKRIRDGSGTPLITTPGRCWRMYSDDAKTPRSYWIPGAYAPPWSEKRTPLLKAIEKEGIQGGKGDNNRVGRPRHIHDPGIQQEPRG